VYGQDNVIMTSVYDLSVRNSQWSF